MSAALINDSLAVYEQLEKEFNVKQPNLSKCGELLDKLKLLQAQLGFPGSNTTDQKELFLAREILEVGAYWSMLLQIYLLSIGTFRNCYHFIIR
jgi:26S proteasome regulatory subunit N12